MVSSLFHCAPSKPGREKEVGSGQGRKGRCLHLGAGRVASGAGAPRCLRPRLGEGP